MHGPGSSADWLRRDRAAVAQSPYAPPLVLDRGAGCELWDVDGRRYLDFESGQFCREGNTLRLAPPLVVAEAQVAEALGLLDAALHAAA